MARAASGGETAASQLTALESESARPVAYALGEAVSAVQLAQTKSTDLSDEKLHSLGLVAGQLSDLSYSPNMSVGDAHSLLLNSQTMLGELVAASAQDAKLYDEATEAIEAVQRILER